MRTLTDDQLASKAKTDITAFETLISKYEKPLLFFIMRISGITLHDAEDILQESYIKCWSHINEYDDTLSFKSWIYRMVRNETITHFRKKKRQNHGHTVKEDLWQFDGLKDDLNLEEEVSAKLHTEHILHTLEQIPQKYKEVLILRYVEDLDYESISDILKKPMGTVATLLNRAKKYLLSHLKYPL